MTKLYLVIHSQNTVDIQPNIAVCTTTSLDPTWRFPIVHPQGTYKTETMRNCLNGQEYRVFANMQNTDPNMSFWILTCTLNEHEAHEILRWGLDGDPLHPGSLLSDGYTVKRPGNGGYTWWQELMFEIP